MILLKLLPLIMVTIVLAMLIFINILSRDSKADKDSKRLRQNKELDEEIAKLNNQNRSDFIRLTNKLPSRNYTDREK